MEKENIENKMETLIFLSKEPVTVEELAKFYSLSLDETKEILSILKEKRKESGINIRIENGAVFLVSNPLYGEDVKKFFNPELKIKKLTKPTMETLAIIAYKGQPFFVGLLGFEPAFEEVFRYFAQGGMAVGFSFCIIVCSVGYFSAVGFNMN